MDSHRFVEFLKKYNSSNSLPFDSDWDKIVNISSQVRDMIRTLFKYTSSDKNEYASSLFFVNSDSFLTPPIKGSRSSVDIRNQIDVTIRQTSQNYAERVVLSDRKVIEKKSIKISQLPKSIKTGFLANFHTHPPHNETKSPQYTFFSETDINSLLNSNKLCLGLITDEIWLVCKTRSSRLTSGKNINEIFNEMRTKGIFFQNDPQLVEKIKSSWKNLGFVFYRGKFNTKLFRIN